MIKLINKNSKIKKQIKKRAREEARNRCEQARNRYIINDNPIMALHEDYAARLIDALIISDSGQDSSCIKELGYVIIKTGCSEITYSKEDSLYDIVWRSFKNHIIVLPELTPLLHFPEGICVLLDETRSEDEQFRKWLDDRNKRLRENPQEVSMCTSNLVNIVRGLLIGDYDIHDEALLKEFEKKLLPFGTDDSKAISDHSVSSPECSLFDAYPHICFVPDEIECIAKVSAEILKEYNTPKKMRAYDMADFKKRLKEEAKDITPTPDIVMFGRNLNGWGLNEYQPSAAL